MVCPFHCIILLSVFMQQARKFLSHDEELKGKNLAATFYAVPGFITGFRDICSLNN